MTVLNVKTSTVLGFSQFAGLALDSRLCSDSSTQTVLRCLNNACPKCQANTSFDHIVSYSIRSAIKKSGIPTNAKHAIANLKITLKKSQQNTTSFEICCDGMTLQI
jgi:hypothetical protein